MDPRDAANRDLLIGLLALQTGLVDQAALVNAFHAWTRDKNLPIAEILVGRGVLEVDNLAALEVLAATHLKRHDSDFEKSLAAINAGHSQAGTSTGVGISAVEETLARLRSAQSGQGDVATQVGAKPASDITVSRSVGAATSEGRRFRVLRPHAEGALGVVFVAVDEELHREVALKQIQDRHADDEGSRARFLIEAEITGGLEHPGIVPVYGLGAYADGRPYYAMRFIRGDNLKEAIAAFHRHDGPRRDPGADSLALHKLLRRFVDVCNAIDYAHGRGVVHRDLKPSNVIMGKHGETLVVDWGLAKAVGRGEQFRDIGERTFIPSSASGSGDTMPGSALGTPAYMSPEQAEGDLDRLGPRSDVYSLGATLYCLLTGQPPFDAKDIGAILRAVQKGEFQPPRQVNPSLSPALEAVCLKAMSLAQDDRYSSAKEVADEVERWMADEPVSARREPLAERSRRWMRKRRTAVTAAAAAVLVALLGMAAVLAVQARSNAELKASNGLLAAANARDVKANADLVASNDRERERFALAMDAIKLFHGEVSEDLLLKERQFEGLRTKLLRGAAGFYGKLEDLLEGQADRPSRSALGKAYSELADLTGKIGDQPEALVIARKALAVRRELAAGRDADPGAMIDVAQSLADAGSFSIGLGDFPGALKVLEEARVLIDGLAATSRASDAARAVLGTSLHRIGKVLAQNGDTTGALRSYHRALAIRQALVDANPSVVSFQNELAYTHNNIGVILRETGDPHAALQSFLRTLAIVKQLADANPVVTKLQGELAVTHSNIGLVRTDSGDLRGALQSHGLALEIQTRLAAANPAITKFQRDEANSQNEIGDILRVTKKTREARASYESSCRILQALIKTNPAVTEYQSLLMQGFRGLGATQEAAGETAHAVATWRQAIALGGQSRSPNGETLSYLAGCHARLGGIAAAKGSGLSADEGTAELDRAMAALQGAIAAGYHPFGWLEHDQDLDPLRSRSDFHALKRDLAFPGEPLAQ